MGVVEPASFSAATNRIANSNWSYGDRGEIAKDPAGRSYGYDGESRMVATCSPDNHEVSCSAAGAAGQLAAEYATAGGDGVGEQYVTADHLGSTRLVTDGSGSGTTTSRSA